MADEVFLSPDDWSEAVPVLIGLADSPDHVATDTSDGFRLRVPAYLAEMYEQYLALPDTPNGMSPEANESPAPRKRGRPRKTPTTSPDEES